MNRKKDLVFFVFGIYFVLLGVLAVINAFNHPEIASPLWFCYIAVFLIGIGILTQNSSLIATQVNIMAIPIIFWNIDFFYHLITGSPLWGITDYFFVGGVNSLGNFITLQHTYILPVSLVFIYIFGLNKKNLLKWSFLEITLIFLASILLYPPAKNVNCVFSSCINFLSLGSPYYQILWFFSVFLMIFLTNSLLVYLIRKIRK